MSDVLRAQRLSKRFGGAPALVNASLTLDRGDFAVILGPSGSGKTTLFRCLTRLTEPDSGEIYVAGEPLHGLRGAALKRARRRIGVVFQQFNLIKRRTALENALMGALGRTPPWRVALGRFSRADVEAAEAALAAVGLQDKMRQRADTLSGGEQQRVAIARALTQKSAVLIADEPVASLDPASAEQVLTLMTDLRNARGMTVLCTLHQPHLARAYASRLFVMRQGRLSEAPVGSMETAAEAPARSLSL
ncbi:MAG: ATP-binding cassette domain-containing protein [Hyphomicrobiales bacterium]|nr:ATP-binding cassette domain-containing protein [Hyphomicrobiales bacterium]